MSKQSIFSLAFASGFCLMFGIAMQFFATAAPPVKAEADLPAARLVWQERAIYYKSDWWPPAIFQYAVFEVNDVPLLLYKFDGHIIAMTLNGNNEAITGILKQHLNEKKSRVD